MGTHRWTKGGVHRWVPLGGGGKVFKGLNTHAKVRDGQEKVSAARWFGVTTRTWEKGESGARHPREFFESFLYDLIAVLE